MNHVKPVSPQVECDAEYGEKQAERVVVSEESKRHRRYTGLPDGFDSFGDGISADTERNLIRTVGLT
jgi:hypothetical protein